MFDRFRKFFGRVVHLSEWNREWIVSESEVRINVRMATPEEAAHVREMLAEMKRHMEALDGVFDKFKRGKG